MTNNRIAGIVMAGGYSRRFGSNKAIAEYKGRPFYEYSIEALKGITEITILVTNKDLYPFYKKETDLQVVMDEEEYRGCGPLAGLYTAMRAYKSEWYLITPVDVPMMTSLILKKLLRYTTGEHQAVIPIINGKKQPLIGLYHYSILEKIHQLLKNNDLKMHFLLSDISALYIEKEFFGEEASFHNINTRQDYEHYLV
ncbi:molybdenum cofactor guanylyltransferase [Bacillus salacetis]|uniref:molybdenum cofactor guanylyltransferase n=1 Tax=Bacillus salacetis TaxID=2315464 RepID=UPI003B9F5E3C